ncbi:hypothetical protein PTQ27_08500 [Mannheimia sp. AT1]|uniref:ACP-like domain-containing protein n=1 Tax=Mannheimia cairinae TaxID=3025936 RepID=A0ABT5MQQ1_9PAST|nr:hypothetical protein [Mannheimia cairinae]MDD0824502.1 hypothetical protein [Mannheimia cairinae]MDD0825603.1 hypothetical protein [Mannheimia cairinae]
MPINLNTTDIAGTNFGDENNFSLSAAQMELDNYRQASINILNPASEILYKACEPVKK